MIISTVAHRKHFAASHQDRGVRAAPKLGRNARIPHWSLFPGAPAHSGGLFPNFLRHFVVPIELYNVANLQVYTVSSFMRRLCQNRLKNSNFENFKTPYLPQMWADSPKIKTMFLRATRTWSGQIGGVGPVRWRSPNCPKPQISMVFAF